MFLDLDQVKYFNMRLLRGQTGHAERRGLRVFDGGLPPTRCLGLAVEDNRSQRRAERRDQEAVAANARPALQHEVDVGSRVGAGQAEPTESGLGRGAVLFDSEAAGLPKGGIWAVWGADPLWQALCSASRARCNGGFTRRAGLRFRYPFRKAAASTHC